MSGSGLPILPVSAPEIIALAAVWPPLCGIIMGLRFYTRKQKKVPLGIDDWLCVPAFILITGMAAALLAGVGLHSVGYPTPKAANPAEAKTATSFQQETTNEILFAFELMQVLALGLVKLSYLFFYKRIFCTDSGSKSDGIYSIIIKTMIGLVSIWTLGFFTTWIFLCRADPEAYWISSATEAAKCIDTGALHNAYAISDFITDCIILLLPIVPVSKLHVSTGRKFALLGVFLLGAVTVAASCTRMVIYQKATAAKFSPGSHVDIDLTASVSMYWSMLESGLGFAAASLPSLYSLFKTKGLQSLIRSIRSIGSLQSGGSATSRSKHSGKSDPGPLQDGIPLRETNSAKNIDSRGTSVTDGPGGARGVSSDTREEA